MEVQDLAGVDLRGLHTSGKRNWVLDPCGVEDNGLQEGAEEAAGAERTEREGPEKRRHLHSLDDSACRKKLPISSSRSLDELFEAQIIVAVPEKEEL